jgi:pimeloyl-ACP methyl ester carboxylesterase
MKTIKILSLFIGGLLALVSCTQENTETYERFYFRTSDGADLAVEVDGNRASKVFILLLHGGPGGSGYEYNTGVYSERLEEKYAMVYLDQRGQGASQGNYPAENLTLQRFADDVYDLTLFLKQKYGQDISVFVMGHSWGGTTGTYAMVNTNIQSEIKGWIEAAGAHDLPLLNKETIKMYLSIGNDEIVAGRNVTEWQEIVDFANTLDTNNISFDDSGQLNGYAFKAEGYISAITEGEQGTASHSFTTAPIYSLSSYLSGTMTANGINVETEKLELTNELYKITTPCLFLWGKYDFVVPPALGESAFAKVSSASKKLVIFDFSGHSLMDNEAAKFSDEIITFVELHK